MILSTKLSQKLPTPNRTLLLLTLVLLCLIPNVYSEKNNKKLNQIQKQKMPRIYQNIDDQSEDYPSLMPSSYPSEGLPSPSMPSRLGGCNSCKMREEIKLRNKELIKEEILKKMGLSAPPNITGKVLPQVPSHYLEEFESYQKDEPYRTGVHISEEEDDFHVQTKKILTFAEPYTRLRHHKGHDVLHFPFTDSITKFHVTNAILNVFIRGVERRPQPNVTIEVFKLKTAKGFEHDMVKVYSGKVMQPLGYGEFVPIDFTQTVGEWFKNPRENYGFVLEAKANGKKVAVTNFDTEKAKTLYVEISTVESKRRKRRHAVLNCDESMNNPICCRYSFDIDFVELGLDFIIAPKKYDAHMCSGECAYMSNQHYPHTHLLKMSAPNSAAPCCVPRKMSSISMLYFDEQLNVVYGSLPGMVVDSCGCT